MEARVDVEHADAWESFREESVGVALKVNEE